MFQYFIKVVSTQFRTLDGLKVRPDRFLHDTLCAEVLDRSIPTSIARQSLNVTYQKE